MMMAETPKRLGLGLIRDNLMSREFPIYKVKNVGSHGLSIDGNINNELNRIIGTPPDDYITAPSLDSDPDTENRFIRPMFILQSNATNQQNQALICIYLGLDENYALLLLNNKNKSHFREVTLEHVPDTYFTDDFEMRIGGITESDLHRAANYGDLTRVQKLISNGAKVDVTNARKWTPLVTASLEGHVEVVKCLIDHGADVNFGSIDDTSPLVAAAQEGHKTIVEILIGSVS